MNLSKEMGFILICGIYRKVFPGGNYKPLELRKDELKIGIAYFQFIFLYVMPLLIALIKISPNLTYPEVEAWSVSCQYP